MIEGQAVGDSGSESIEDVGPRFSRNLLDLRVKNPCFQGALKKVELAF